MDKTIYETWLGKVGTLDIDTQDVYTLLNPNDRKLFFEVVNKVIDSIVKLNREGNNIDLTKRREFRTLAILYLIEFEKDKTTSTPTVVTYPTNIPSYPTVPECPWQIPQVWCTTASGTNYTRS